MRTIQAVLYQRNKKDKAGIIKIRVTEDRKATYVTTGEKLPVRLWNDKRGIVKESDEVDYERINRIIEDKLKEVKAQYDENVRSNRNTSFIGFFRKVIERQSNEGTKIKYGTILSKVESYLADSKQTDLTFKQINEDVIYAMRSYFIKGMQEDTADHYLKVIKAVIRKAVKANMYNYYRNPFEGIDLMKDVSKAPSSLTGEMLQRLINAQIENQRIESHRRAFLFQVFCQGMRISDLLVLRWNNFRDGRVEYTMLKTQKQMSVLLNDNLLVLLRPTVERYAKQGESMRETIDRLSIDKKYRNSFVFSFLSDEEFSCVGGNNDFSKISRELYVRLNKKSIVYNRNLKDVQKQAGIRTSLSSHTARHTFASLLLDGDVNLYAISQSLGHSDIKITQKYLSNFGTKKLDDVNASLVSRFKM
ncbi:tyrosine-type recombinase/integrase [Pontibacter sp. FD36]|uniref:tyrosine-type recombinase/integrase n=1 Tax=Pontibacter sp. FD36 TaxID=2789860 RepID=UPI0018A909AF|nr:tyrosine-type recombinase/integrase [Pontibacter sp. FD36]MBF8964302.1 tyrosine-type recombinase/integrase [Pontibacter sp. FD36]